MEMQSTGQAVQIVKLAFSPSDSAARLGEAWKFRQTFERARALMKAQDNWCLKAQAAASTGKLSIMQGEDFPSELELDVIVGNPPEIPSYTH